MPKSPENDRRSADPGLNPYASPTEHIAAPSRWSLGRVTWRTFLLYGLIAAVATVPWTMLPIVPMRTELFRFVAIFVVVFLFMFVVGIRASGRPTPTYSEHLEKTKGIGVRPWLWVIAIGSVAVLNGFFDPGSLVIFVPFLLLGPLIVFVYRRSMRRLRVLAALEDRDFPTAEELLASYRLRRFDTNWALTYSVLTALTRAAVVQPADEPAILQQARQFADALVEKWPRRATSYTALAAVFNRQRRYDEALAAAERAAQLKPQAFYVLLVRGSIRQCVAIARQSPADFAAAKEDLEKAYRRAPRLDAEAQHALARFLAATPDAATRDPKRAIELERGVGDRLRARQYEGVAVLAAAHANLGRFQEAVELARAASEQSRPEERPRFDRLLQACNDSQPFYLTAEGRWWPW